MKRLTVLRVLLSLVCISHLILGLIGFLSISEMVTQAAATFYGASVVITPQMLHVVRILGAFMIAIGVLSGFALANPQQNRAIIHGIVVLLVLRVSQRVIFGAEVHQVFQISYGQLWMQSIFFLALAVALFVFRPKPELTAKA